MGSLKLLELKVESTKESYNENGFLFFIFFIAVGFLYLSAFIFKVDLALVRIFRLLFPESDFFA